MNAQSFTITLQFEQTPQEVFNAINNVRGWWSEGIAGKTESVDDEFTYHYKDVHNCKMRITESIPGHKVVWHVLDNYFSFTKDKSEWIGTDIVFEISKQGNKTVLRFSHEGLVPAYECFNACVSGWTQYVQQSLVSLVTTGKGQPNTDKVSYTVYEIAAQFSALAQQEKWFEIQDELFAENVRSIEPANSPWLKNAEGKAAVRKKGEDWVKMIEAVHKAHTTEPVVGGNYFSVGREIDFTIQGLGRIQSNEIMMYEVKDGKIISEQFFY